MAQLDLVLSGGEVVDGTGSAARRADVGVLGRRIATVAAPGTLRGAVRLDATGLVVTPGFIDPHSHADFSLHATPGADTCVRQGVTTLVTGNCGFSPAPVRDLDLLRANVGFLNAELPWDWNDMAGYTRSLAEARPAVNVAAQVGHHALRIAALGAEDREPTPDELGRMCQLLAEAARGGAIGFSTGLIYAPGCYADRTEIRALLQTAARCDLLYSTHIRNETDHVLAAVDEALADAEATGARLEISHLKAMARPNHGKVDEALRRIDEARLRGLDVAADVYPYTASSTTLTSRLPPWSVSGGAEALLRRLADPSARRRIEAELGERMRRDVDPNGVVLAAMPPGEFTASVGRSIAEVGAALETSPQEAALRVLEAHQARVSIINHSMSERDVRTVLAHPAVSVGSDGGVMRASGAGRPHPRSFGTFARVLGRYVRDEALLSLPEAVRKMTSLPASRLRLPDRGRIAEGCVADLVAFDAAEIVDVSSFDDPWRLAVGVHHVLVNGVPALLGGEPTGRHAGEILRRSTSEPAPSA